MTIPRPTFPSRLTARLRIALASLRLDAATRRLAEAVARRSKPHAGKRPIIFFNASTRIRGHSLNAAFSLLSSWALRMQGVPVVHFVCGRGMTHCLQGTDQDNLQKPMPCDLCLRQSRVNFTASPHKYFSYQGDSALASALEKLDLESLRRFELPFEDTFLPVGALVLPSMRWRLRLWTLTDDEPTRYLYRQFILSARSVLLEFDRLLGQVQAQALVIFNGQTFPEAVARWLAVRRGVKVVTHEVSMAPFSAFFTAGEATALPMPIPPAFELTPAQEQQLDELMQSRFQGGVSMAGISFFPEMQALAPAFLEKAAAFECLVPIFTNVIFDTTQQHSNTLFANMFAWLDSLLPVMRAHPQTLFVLRAHPDEARPGKTSRESVAMWAERSGAAALPNLVFVPPDQFISSYELIRRAKFVLIYNSTVGLEASIMGKPVLAAGNARFTSFNTLTYPPEAATYQRLLDEFLSAASLQADRQHIHNARRFFYFHYFIASLPFGEFIEPASLRGFVKWKPFSLEALTPAASPTVRSLSEGILGDGDFTLPDSY